MTYQIVETSKGLSNFLKIYKATMISLGLKPGSKIAYIGCAGTCLPFIELFALSFAKPASSRYSFRTGS